MATADNKQTIAKILNINISDSWDILDSDPSHNLYLIHYSKEADMNQFGDLRGIVIDILAQTIVCRSFGFTPSAVSDQLAVSPDGKLHISDLNGTEHIINPEQLKIKIGYEGTIMRVFKHGGKVYHSTHRKLDTSRSKWGNSITFEEMYRQLGGPDDDVLFNTESEYSPYCHIFLMVHPDVLNVTKDNVGSGYMVYLGPKELWSYDPENSPYKQTSKEGNPLTPDWENDPRPNAGWVDATLRMPETVDTLPADRTKSRLLAPFNISFEDANQHLRYGFYKPFDDHNLDPRLRTGEFVMLYKINSSGQISGLLRVQSTAYQWRTEMRANDPNLLYRFYQLLNGSYIQTEFPEGLAEYKLRYPIMTRYSVNSIQQHIVDNGPFIVWPMTQPTTDELIKTKDDRLYNIWLCYLMAVPLHRQYDVSKMYDNLINNRSKVIQWLRTLNNTVDIGDLEIPDRAKKIITVAREFARDRTAKGNNQDRYGKLRSIDDLTRDNIRNLIMKEEGSSLYRLVKAMNDYLSS